MIDTKQKAKYILEAYANCYSQVDLEQLAKHLDEIKAEAYKEFWNSRPERLNEQCKGREEYNKGWNACLDEFWEIRNNLFYELVGEDKWK